MLAPKAALILLASQDASSRQEGLELLRAVLWKDSQPIESYPFLKATRRQFLDAALGYLTPEQQVKALFGDS